MIATRIETMKQGRPGKDANLHDISRERVAELMNTVELGIFVGAETNAETNRRKKVKGAGANPARTIAASAA